MPPEPPARMDMTTRRYRLLGLAFYAAGAAGVACIAAMYFGLGVEFEFNAPTFTAGAAAGAAVPIACRLLHARWLRRAQAPEH